MRAIVEEHLNPDCRDGKHKACRGDAWCVAEDISTDCDCPCHDDASHNNESGV